MDAEPARKPNYGVLLVMVVCALVVIVDRVVTLPALRALTTTLYGWVLILGAVAVVLGVANVAWVHLRAIVVGAPGWTYSLALVAALVAVIATGLFSPAGDQGPLVTWLFDSLIAPGQASLFALLAFFLAGAAYQYLRVGRVGGAWILAGALVILLVQTPVLGAWLPPALARFAAWTLDVPGMATLRGALLGAGVAAVIVGVRYLITAE